MFVEAHGPAPADQAWQRYLTPATWPSWAEQMREVTCTHEVLQPGSTGVVHGPLGSRVDFEVESVDPERRSWTWRVHRGPLALRLHHAIVPSGDGGSVAVMRTEGATGLVAEPYRLLARSALRRLVAGVESRAGTSETVHRFDFDFDHAYRAPAAPFGVRPDTTSVEIGPQWVFVRFGPWRLLTPRTNVESAQLVRDLTWWKTAGPARLSLADRGVSFTTNARAAVCMAFREPVSVLDPTGELRHPGATVSVSAPARLAALLSAGPGDAPRT